LQLSQAVPGIGFQGVRGDTLGGPVLTVSQPTGRPELSYIHENYRFGLFNENKRASISEKAETLVQVVTPGVCLITG